LTNNLDADDAFARKPENLLDDDDDDDDDDANEPNIARSASNNAVIATTMDGGNDIVTGNRNPKRNLSHMPNNSDPDRACSLKIQRIVDKEDREIFSVDLDDDDHDDSHDGSRKQHSKYNQALAKMLPKKIRTIYSNDAGRATTKI